MVEHTTTDGKSSKYDWQAHQAEAYRNICQAVNNGFKDKQDAGKPRWDLLPIRPIEEVVEVLTDGAAKYSENGWQKVSNAKERYFAALMRHIVAWREGQTCDIESGKSHLIHAICNLLFLYHFDLPVTTYNTEMEKKDEK